MELFEAILSRRSVRRYTGRPVPEELVEQLLRAAHSAPSANRGMPWEFVVVRRRETLDKLRAVCRNWGALETAGLCIVVAARLTGYPSSHLDFYMQDCGACTENLLLAAQGLGLGAVWLGCCPVEERMKAVGELLNLPEGVVAFALVPVGYPAEEPARERAERPIPVHLERY